MASTYSKSSGKARPGGFQSRPGPVPGASISTGGPWPNAPFSPNKYPTSQSSQNNNTAAMKGDGRGRIKGTSKIAPY